MGHHSTEKYTYERHTVVRSQNEASTCYTLERKALTVYPNDVVSIDNHPYTVTWASDDDYYRLGLPQNTENLDIFEIGPGLSQFYPASLETSVSLRAACGLDDYSIYTHLITSAINSNHESKPVIDLLTTLSARATLMNSSISNYSMGDFHLIESNLVERYRNRFDGVLCVKSALMYPEISYSNTLSRIFQIVKPGGFVLSERGITYKAK
ncbi:hypothetical protein KBD69_01805 [Candidatus Woesebacteria bacterium]|nr:hypothetical protein [Candidatus Woesebacteria bacterium]